ncbi:MAG: DUF3592 domain-containing protein [Roseiflexaceae bacterium]|nr:DUF3592 domain-containing protein [Roseiflexaceae bacterium]
MDVQLRVRDWNPFSAFVSGLMALAIGLGVLYLGQLWRTHTQNQVAAMVKAQGAVVEVVPRTQTRNNGERSTLFYAVVEFRTANGEVIRFEDSTGSNPPAYRVGDTVEVLYDPQTPQSAMIDSWMIWLPSTIVMGFGGFIALMGGLALLDAFFKLLKIGGLLGLLAFLLLRRRRGQHT